MIESYLYWLIIGLVVIALAAMYRALIGPSAIDRVIVLNIITTEVVMIMLIFAYLDNTFLIIDVALVFVLAAFIATLCVLNNERDTRHSCRDIKNYEKRGQIYYSGSTNSALNISSSKSGTTWRRTPIPVPW